jgi:hypothetical protein
MSCKFTIADHIEHHAILGVTSGGGGGGGGEFTTVSHPLELDGYNISMPPATNFADGYMTLDDHQLLPTSGQKDALVGTDGTPSTANPYVTNSDPRLSGGGGGGELTTVSAPLVLDGYNISMPPSTDLVDGYMTAADHTLLNNIQSTPPGSPFAGMQWYSTTDNQQYVYDGYRSKFLSPSPFKESTARNTANVTDIYLYSFDGTPSNEAPLVLPFDCTLVGMTASGAVNETWQAEVHLSLSVVSGALLLVEASTTAFSFDFDIDFSAGDAVQTFMNGTSIDTPRVNLFFARRGS